MLQIEMSCSRKIDILDLLFKFACRDLIVINDNEWDKQYDKTLKLKTDNFQ